MKLDIISSSWLNVVKKVLPDLVHTETLMIIN